MSSGRAGVETEPRYGAHLEKRASAGASESSENGAVDAVAPIRLIRAFLFARRQHELWRARRQSAENGYQTDLLQFHGAGASNPLILWKAIGRGRENVVACFVRIFLDFGGRPR